MWVKNNQRGEQVKETVEITSKPLPFSRDTTGIIYTDHAKCRMGCRFIDDAEVKEVIMTGDVNYDKIQEDEKGKTYPVEGVTRDKQNVRIVVAPRSEELVIVTVIDLDTDWECNCN